MGLASLVALVWAAGVVAFVARVVAANILFARRSMELTATVSADRST
jgi:hypothetical protein